MILVVHSNKSTAQWKLTGGHLKVVGSLAIPTLFVAHCFTRGLSPLCVNCYSAKPSFSAPAQGREGRIARFLQQCLTNRVNSSIHPLLTHTVAPQGNYTLGTEGHALRRYRGECTWQSSKAFCWLGRGARERRVVQIVSSSNWSHDMLDSPRGNNPVQWSPAASTPTGIHGVEFHESKFAGTYLNLSYQGQSYFTW